MEVEYELTTEDVAVFQRYHRRHPPMSPKRRQNPLVWAIYIIGSLTLVLMAVCGSVQTPLRITLLSVIPAFGFGAIFALWGCAHYSALTAPQNARRVLEEGRNAEKVLGWRRCRIDGQGIHMASNFFSLTYWWRGVDVIAATDEYAFFYVTTATAYIVPLRAFADGRTFDVFVETARRYHEAASSGGYRDGRVKLPPSTDIRLAADSGLANGAEGVIQKDHLPDETEPRP